jgi:hypothetical protein
VLAARTPFSFDDSVALQRETFSQRAAALRGLLKRVRAPDLAADVAMLRPWDGHVDAASEAADRFRRAVAVVPEQMDIDQSFVRGCYALCIRSAACLSMYPTKAMTWKPASVSA